MSHKKGDLEVTLLEGRNINNKGCPVYCKIEIKSQRNTITRNYYCTNASKDTKWNYTAVLDLMSLDGEELVIQLFRKRHGMKKDKFLGQSQLTISALGLSKEPEWHYLTDVPESERTNKSTELKRSKSLTKMGKKKTTYIIQGEIFFKLHFVHRLIRAKTKTALREPNSPTLPTHSFSMNRLHVPAQSLTANKSDDEAQHTAKQYETPSLKRSASLGTADMAATLEVPNKPLLPEEETLTVTEEVIIDEALKEKQKIVKEKLEESERLVRTMTSRIIQLENTNGEDAVKDDKNKLEIIKKEMSEMEKLLAATSTEEPVFRRPALTLTKAQRNITGRDRVRAQDLRFSTLPRNSSLAAAFAEPTPSSSASPPPSSSTPAHSSSSTPARPKLQHTKSSHVNLPRFAEEKDKDNENSWTNTRPPLPQPSSSENSWTHSRPPLPSPSESPLTSPSVSPAVSPSITPAAMPSRKSLTSALPAVPPKPTKKIPPTPSSAPAEKFADPAVEVQVLRAKVSLLEKTVETLETSNSILVQEVSRLERDLARYHKEEELREREERLREREERLLALENNTRPRRATSVGQDDRSQRSDADMEIYESDAESVEDLSESSLPAITDAKYEMIVSKLEKLDKLDELLRKLDNMKIVTNLGGDEMSNSGKSYAELKVELEGIQAVIMDESGKYTEKQKEEANIKYEKVSQEFQQTAEYKREVAAALEERRRVNEPLNKAALEKMLRVYTPEAIRDNEEIKEKVQKNPELGLIGLDPKVILAKHQNDFQQYMLRNLSLDELRAVRASLPKFRNDQKRQSDWVETLEQKIEVVSKDPPKPPVKKAAAIKIRTKPPGCGGDFLAELRAKQKTGNGLGIAAN